MSKLEEPTTWARQRGVALRAARAAAGLTQEALADLLGCRRNTVSNAERGVHQLADDMVESWWRVTGCTPSILVQR